MNSGSFKPSSFFSTAESGNLFPDVLSNSVVNQFENPFNKNPFLIKTIQQIQFNGTAKRIFKDKIGLVITLSQLGFENATIHFLMDGFFFNLFFLGSTKTMVGQTTEGPFSITANEFHHFLQYSRLSELVNYISFFHELTNNNSHVPPTF